jgi:4-amino-4-deoxy-L-arabinose transferase-like glycosyltransferase
MRLAAQAGAPHVRGWLTGLVAVGLLIRLAGLAGTADLGTRILDEVDYRTLATSIVDGRGFAFESGPTSLRPPLYPAFVAGVWAVTGTRSLQAVRTAQIALALATMVMVFAIGRDLFGANAGLAAAALACFYPSLLISNYLLLTEVLFAALVTASVWAIVRLFQRGSAWTAAAAGCLLGLAALTRSVIYPFPILLALLLVTSLRQTTTRRLLLATVMLVSYVMVLTPWAVRNTRLQGVPVLVDTMGGLNLRMGNYEYTPLQRAWDAVSETGERSWVAGIPKQPDGGGAWTEGKKERWARGLAVRFMVAHPALTVWRAAIKFGDFWGLERDFIAGIQQGLFHPPAAVGIALSLAILVSFPLVLFLAIVQIARLTGPDWVAGFVPLLLVLFICALHAIVFGHPRYRLPEMPLLCVYAGAAVTAHPLRLPVERWRRVAAIVAMSFFAVLWAVQFVWRDWTYAERFLKVAVGS